MIESNERDINILMLIYNFCPLIGGTEKQCLLQAKKLEEMGHKVQILTTEQNGQSSFEIIDGLEVYRKIFKRSRGIIRLLVFVCSTVFQLVKKRRKYNIVHVHQLNATAIAAVIAKFLTKKPVVCKLACTGEYGDFHIIKSMRFAKIYFALLRHIDRLIAISEDTSREAKENGFADKTVNIPNGVLIPEGNTGLISKPEKVLFLGKLSKQKGADIFVEAAGLNPDSQFRFIVVGDGPLFNILKKNSADNVFFEGGTNQPEKYLLDRKTVFALPSRGEGLSNSLLEAMAYGLPSIISEDVSGAHDLAGKELLNAGLFSAHENLILIKPENPYSLSGALKYLGDNPHYAQQISEKSREYVKNKFSIDLVSERLESLYRQIINQ